MSRLHLALLPEVSRDAATFWRARLEPIAAVKRGRTQLLRQLAEECDVSYQTALRKFYAFLKGGLEAVVDKRKDSALWKTKNPGLSATDKALVKTYCENDQRGNDAAVRRLRTDWRMGKIQTRTPINPATGYPKGWSCHNLARHAPTTFELQAARIGRTAAASYRPLVYTTRANLYVGQYYLFDDMWHDHEVNRLDQAKRGRPLEFHALDLASACKFAWGIRMRMEVDGIQTGLKGDDFRFLLASSLMATGYHPNGTTLIVEHGTAAISEDIERLLYDATDGAIKVDRSGMQGAASHAGQYAGRSKGNFRFKAALESLGNLIHNEMAMLPGQVGKDRDHSPEQMAGLMKHNDALLRALAYLHPEQIQMLQWPLLTLQQFQTIAGQIYGHINNRTEHELEGWDMRYVPDPRLGRMRRMSPHEVFTPGRRALRPLDRQTAALVLGTAGGVERMTRSGLIELRDGEISGDVLRFDATMLADREKYLTVLNPFAPDSLTIFDAKGRHVATLDRIFSEDRDDAEAVQRACGRAAKQEAALLAPLRARHINDAREKTRMHNQNARVLAGDMTPRISGPKFSSEEIADVLSTERVNVELSEEEINELCNL